MNAQTPRGAMDPDKAEPIEVETQQELPGLMATGDTENAAEMQRRKNASGAGAPPAGETQEEKDAKSAAAAAHKAIQFMSFNELLAEIKTIKPETTDDHLKAIGNFFKVIDDGFKGKMGIPKVSDQSPVKNGHLALVLLQTLKPHSQDSEKSTFTCANGSLSVSPVGIFFHAGTDAQSKAPKPFTALEARQIAILAMHNKDLLPPNTMQITGSKAEQALIRKELVTLNQLLPENARFIIEDDAPASAPRPSQERGPSLTDRIGDGLKSVFSFGKGKSPAQAAEAPAEPVQPVAATPAADETLDLTNKVDLTAQEQREIYQAALNEDPKFALKQKIIGGHEVEKDVVQPVHAASLPSADGKKEVHYVANNDGTIKVLGVEGDENFGKYLVGTPQDKPASELNNKFDTAADTTQNADNRIEFGVLPEDLKGVVKNSLDSRFGSKRDYQGAEATWNAMDHGQQKGHMIVALSDFEQNSPNFVGPRTPPGWTPPTPPAV